MRRFVTVFVLVLVVQIGVVIGINGHKYFVRNEGGEGTLLSYQIDKIETHEKLDTIFVGDSTLGNALDATLFDRLAGTRSLNLALTGDYGFAGSLNLIERGLSRHPLRRVVIVQSFDQMTREVSYDGYVYTLDLTPSLRQLWLGRFDLMKQILARLIDFRTVVPRLSAPAQRHQSAIVDPAVDYVPQRHPIDPNSIDALPIPSDAVRPQKRLFLDYIAELCRANSLDCFYLHGPIYQPIHNGSQAYLTAVNEIIVSTGLQLVDPGLTPLTAATLGDTPDHVHPKDKHRYTRQLYDLLSPRLDR